MRQANIDKYMEFAGESNAILLLSEVDGDYTYALGYDAIQVAGTLGLTITKTKCGLTLTGFMTRNLHEYSRILTSAGFAVSTIMGVSHG